MQPLILCLLLVVATTAVTNTNSQIICANHQCRSLIALSELEVTPHRVPIGDCFFFRLMMNMNPIAYGVELLSAVPKVLWRGVELQPLDMYSESASSAIAPVTDFQATVTSCACLPTWHRRVTSNYDQTGLEGLHFGSCTRDNCHFPTALGNIAGAASPEVGVQFVQQMLAALTEIISPEMRLADLRIILEATLKVAHEFRSFSDIQYVISGPLHVNIVAAVSLALRTVCDHCHVIVPALTNNIEHTRRRIEAVPVLKVWIPPTHIQSD